MGLIWGGLLVCTRAFSPLEGFMSEQQYLSVVQNMRLPVSFDTLFARERPAIQPTDAPVMHASPPVCLQQASMSCDEPLVPGIGNFIKIAFNVTAVTNLCFITDQQQHLQHVHCLYFILYYS